MKTGLDSHWEALKKSARDPRFVAWIRRSRTDQSFRNVVGTTLVIASLLLMLVGILLNSSALFYMTTALVAMLGTCRLQSWLAVRGLRIERTTPETVMAGDLVTVPITIWSEYRIRRPLITVKDALPKEMIVGDISPSLPVAPAFDAPIQTQYQFRPLKRGHYKWSGIKVEGTDALGLTLTERHYPTEQTSMTVLPCPSPIQLELPTAMGWGTSEMAEGSSRGAGIEPRGVREYVYGDSLRYVHWVSSAHMNRLMVKEFEAGSSEAAFFVLQRTRGADVGVRERTTLEAMCSHTAFLVEQLLRQGAYIEFPVWERRPKTVTARERMANILDLLARVNADAESTLGQDIQSVLNAIPSGAIIFALAAIADPTLIDAAADCKARGIALAPILYDAAAFVPKQHSLAFYSATRPEFIDSLRRAGARALIVPKEAYPS
jgi:uncharacterized protein (DUF58 family)